MKLLTLLSGNLASCLCADINVKKIYFYILECGR